jgi:hypothetical protein
LKNGIEFTEAEFTENHAWLKQTLQHEINLDAFGKEEADRGSLASDQMVQKGIDDLPKAKALLETAKKMMVQRTNPRAAEAARR